MCHHLSILSTRDGLSVTVADDVRGIRDYLVCCILRRVDLSGFNLKTFLSGQVSCLHPLYNEQQCSKLTYNPATSRSNELT